MALTTAKAVVLKLEHIEFLAQYFGFSDPQQTFNKYEKYKDTFISIVKDITLNTDGSKTTIIVGICLFRLHQPVYNKGLISYIAVNDNYRGRGIATQLVNAAETYMSLHGITISTTNIRHNNIASIAAFKSNGYIIKDFNNEYSNGNQKYNLEKQL